MRLTPEQLYSLTPGEFSRMAKETARVLEASELRQLEKLAVLVTHIVQPWTKKRISPDKLLRQWTKGSKEKPTSAPEPEPEPVKKPKINLLKPEKSAATEAKFTKLLRNLKYRRAQKDLRGDY